MNTCFVNKRNLLVSFVTAVIAVSLTTQPAYADSSSGLSSSAQQAASINDLKASDAQLIAAVTTLNNEVTSQQAAVDSAKQAVDAANDAVNASNASLQSTLQQLSGLRAKEQQRAIEQYMAPSDNLTSTLLAANGVGDAARRSEFITELSGDDVDALDSLTSVQHEMTKQHKDALAAQKVADDRRDTEQKKLDTYNAALADQSKVEAAMKARIAADAAEDSVSSSASPQAQPGRASRGGDTSADDSRVSSEGLQWPVHGSHQINSPYGMRWGRMHEGIDIYATAGQAIYAAKAGTVTFAGQESGYGGYVCIQHGGSFQTCYAHETKIMVSVGQSVAQGDELGLAGATGDAQGVNLHFETCTSTGKECFYGTFHNPVDYLP